MKWYWNYLAVIVTTVLVYFVGEVGVDLIISMKLKPSDWIQLIASVTAVFAFIGLIIQIRIQNVQGKREKRPHFSAVFMNWVKAGDVAVSEATSWDFRKYYKGMISISSIGDVAAIDLFLVATYSSGEKDYLYLPKLEHDQRSLDFQHGTGFEKFEIFFKTSVEEYGKANFIFEKYIVTTPKYTWGTSIRREYNKVVAETNKRRLEAKSNFSSYSFNEDDIKGAHKFNKEMMKQNIISDKKSEAINEYLYGNKNGRLKDDEEDKIKYK